MTCAAAGETWTVVKYSVALVVQLLLRWVNEQVVRLIMQLDDIGKPPWTCINGLRLLLLPLHITVLLPLFIAVSCADLHLPVYRATMKLLSLQKRCFCEWQPVTPFVSLCYCLCYYLLFTVCDVFVGKVQTLSLHPWCCRCMLMHIIPTLCHLLCLSLSLCSSGHCVRSAHHSSVSEEGWSFTEQRGRDLCSEQDVPQCFTGRSRSHD